MSDVTEKVGQLEERILKLERITEELMRSSTARPQPESLKEMLPQSEPVPNIEMKYETITKHEPENPVDWEHQIGRVWLPRIFIIVLLLGVVWGFSAAVSSGIITKPVRCLIGALVSFGMIFIGERQFLKSRQALGQVLDGGAIAILMLSTFAAVTLYDLIPSYLAFVLNMVWIVTGIFLAFRHKSQTLLIVSAVAGFLMPFLVASSQNNYWLFGSYETIFSLFLLYVALTRRYTALYYVSLGLVQFAFIAAVGIRGFDHHLHKLALDSMPIGWFAIANHMGILLAFLYFKQYRHSDKIASLFTSFAVTAAWCHLVFHHSSYIAFLSLSIALYALLAWYASKWIREYVGIFSSIAAFAVFLLIFSQSSYKEIPILFVIEGVIALILGLSVKSKLQQFMGSFILMIGSLITLVNPIHILISIETITWVLLMVSLLVLHIFIMKWNCEMWKNQALHIRWSIGVLLLIFITEVTQTLTASSSINVQHLVLSFVWITYAILCTVSGFIWDKKGPKLAGMILLLVTLLKLVFIDIPDVSLAVRAVLFIILGAIGVGLSRFYYRK